MKLFFWIFVLGIAVAFLLALFDWNTDRKNKRKINMHEYLLFFIYSLSVIWLTVMVVVDANAYIVIQNCNDPMTIQTFFTSVIGQLVLITWSFNSARALLKKKR